MPAVKPFWFQIHFQAPGRKPLAELRLYTGTDLASVLDGIQAAQRGRLRYNPRAPRIIRIAALAPPALDAASAAFVDECIRLESNTATTF